ncbi:hypothetical protein CMI37_21280 [Candidatus Pacearchaeota archaeon]|nr:hypothetical protein [Candidatus Pacearchaeota archaeon]|tara:strand:- start:560 stop:808 length:249 start_codon:yes stop_codon:yes gene_type:complete
MSKSKPGVKSTEFWLATCGMIGGLVLSILPDNAWTQVIGGLLAAICGASYTLGRSWAKGKVDSAHATAKIVGETLLKKKSSD